MSLPLQVLAYTLLLVPLTASIWPIWPMQTAIPDGLTLLLAGLIGGVSFLQTNNATLHIPRLILPLLALLGSTILSGAFADYSITTPLLWQVITLALLVLALPGLGHLRAVLGNSGYILLIGRGLLLLGILYSLGSLATRYGVFDGAATATNLNPRLEGLWKQPNLTTTTIWLALTVGLLAGFQNRNVWFAAGLTALFGIVCALTASRITILFLAFVGILAWVAWRSDQSALKTQGVRIATAGGIILVCLLVLPPIIHSLEGRAGYSSERSVSLIDREVDAYPRLVEHQKIVSTIPDWGLRDLLVGVGPGNYGHFSYQHPLDPSDGAAAQGGWLHSHNIFSMILVEQGIIGLATIFSLLASLLICIWRNRHHAYTLPIAAGLGILFLHSNVEFPLWYPWFALTFVTLAVPLFDDYQIRIESTRIISIVGALIIVIAIGSASNIGMQAHRIMQVSSNPDPGQSDYRTIRKIETSSLVGPYATLTGYQQFAPGMFGIDSQIERAADMAHWRPLGVIKVRQTMLLLRAGDADAACEMAQMTTTYYPTSGSVIVKQAISDSDAIKIDLPHLISCVESGLKIWDEDLASQNTPDTTLRR